MRNRVVAALVIAVGVIAAGSPAFGRKAAAGRPGFKAGDPEAFYIWVDSAGWHLRMTTGKKKHIFHGVIRGAGFAEVKATRKSLQPKIEATATAIRFELELFEGVEGFDWQANTPCTTWELKLDELPKVDRIHVGEKGESPSAMPFDACQ